MKRTKPVIGISSDFHPGGRNVLGSREPTYFLRARYVSAIQDLGGVPFILPLTADPDVLKIILRRISGLLLTGSGPDLNPELYGEAKRHRFKIMSPQRAEFELSMAREAIQRELPVLGLCGGMQALNVAFGGTLIQDIASECQGALRHQQKDAAIYPSHEVRIAQGSVLSSIIGGETLRVNSSHHQAVKTPGKGLVVNAMANDGVIEGLECPGQRFALGVQWHPEFLYRDDELNRRIFRSFLEAAAAR